MNGWVSLEGLEFFAHHGVYDHERAHGNTFIVDISVRVNLGPASKSDDINDTLNYEVLAECCKEAMTSPSNTLEHVARRIVEAVFQETSTTKIRLRVVKSTPPITVTCKASSVSLTITRKQFNTTYTS